MTKLEYWKSVQDGDFIQACKNAGINLVSTNVSDARAEFICIDLESKLGIDYFESRNVRLDLFLVGLKLKDLTSYEYGKLFTLNARLDEESVWDRIPCEIDFEETIKTSDYIIKACKSILNRFPSNIVKEVLEHVIDGDSFDKDDELSWWRLIYDLITEGEQPLECDAYLLGKMHEIIKGEGLGDIFVVSTLNLLLSYISYVSINKGKLYYGYNLLRSYIQGETFKDSLFIDSEIEFMNCLNKNISEILRNGCNKSECEDIDELINCLEE